MRRYQRRNGPDGQRVLGTRTATRDYPSRASCPGRYSVLTAVEFIRPMRGGSQSQLFRDETGGRWVVKFLNNPQHPRVLANEWIASSLARAVGLTVPDFAIMDVPGEIIARSPELGFRDAGRVSRPMAGLAFASRLPTRNDRLPTYDYPPEAALETVQNLAEFAGVLVLDKWLCQCDGRQVVFCRPGPRSRTKAFFIDWGFVFNAGEWTFPDSPLRGVYTRNAAYQGVTGWASFEPWLSRIESFPDAKLRSIVAAIPPEWAGEADLRRLEAEILARRAKVRGLIEAVRSTSRNPFPNWLESPVPAATITQATA